MEFPDNILGGIETVRGEASGAPLPCEDKLLGVVLDGRFLIERKLGQGGFGAIYLAADLKIAPRKVVVKVMRAEETQNENSVKNFKREIEALTQIDHPSVVGIFDTGKTPDGKPYIVMQYVDGVSLRALITPDGMEFPRAANILKQMGRALTAAHQCGILHRDLKPENVMIQKLAGDDEHVKIIDFGIAKVKNSIVSLRTPKDNILGTIAYMSPEQLSTKDLTPASDIYSLGVIAYELQTGRRPLNPDTVFQLSELQRAGVRIKPTELRPNLPKAAETIILKALSFEPENRYQQAREFGDLLSTALLNQPEQNESSSESDSREMSLETADVLFMDIVGYSKLLIDQQRDQLNQLQRIVLATDDCHRTNQQNLIRLPTGDGMALVFFGDPEAPVRCAAEISRSLKNQPDIGLRMGVHSGLVYRMADINTNMNVAGGGINIAQRVMDCGDSGHIIVSKRVADDLAQVARWSSCLHDLGSAEVKHGLKLQVFNFYGDDFGNPEHPSKLRRIVTRLAYLNAPVLVAAVLVIGLIAGGLWYVARTKTKVGPEPARTEVVAAVGPTQSLTYSLTVQKMLNGKALGDPIESAGDISFGNGWKFRFNVRPLQSGALYLINAGPAAKGTEYNLLFPLPQGDRLDPRLVANQTIQAGWYIFGEQTGMERLWILWSTHPVAELDAIVGDAVRNRTNPGVIANADQIARLESYLKEYESDPPELTVDKSKKLTLVKGRGKTFVTLVELSHEAY